MNITSAKYVQNVDGENDSVTIVVDGKQYAVPMDPDNRHYAEILRQVAAGTLTIADAD